MTDSELLARFLQNRQLLDRAVMKALDSNPKLNRWLTEHDLSQDVMLRMVQACREIEVNDRQHFIRLLLRNMRFALIDNHRKMFGPNGWAAKIKSDPNAVENSKVTKSDNGPVTVEDWVDFHDSVESLPQEEQEVFELIYYGGYGSLDVAEMLGISQSTAQRRWKKAVEILQNRLDSRRGD